MATQTITAATFQLQNLQSSPNATSGSQPTSTPAATSNPNSPPATTPSSSTAQTSSPSTLNTTVNAATHASTASSSPPSTSSGPSPSRRRSTWKPTLSICCKVLITVAGLLAAYLALSQGYTTIAQGKASLALAKWEAQHDYIESCQNVRTASSYVSTGCKEALDQQLPPPPISRDLRGHAKRGLASISPPSHWTVQRLPLPYLAVCVVVMVVTVWCISKSMGRGGDVDDRRLERSLWDDGCTGPYAPVDYTVPSAWVPTPTARQDIGGLRHRNINAHGFHETNANGDSRVIVKSQRPIAYAEMKQSEAKGNSTNTVRQSFADVQAVKDDLSFLKRAFKPTYENLALEEERRAQDPHQSDPEVLDYATDSEDETSMSDWPVGATSIQPKSSEELLRNSPALPNSRFSPSDKKQKRSSPRHSSSEISMTGSEREELENLRKRHEAHQAPNPFTPATTPPRRPSLDGSFTLAKRVEQLGYISVAADDKLNSDEDNRTRDFASTSDPSETEQSEVSSNNDPGLIEISKKTAWYLRPVAATQERLARMKGNYEMARRVEKYQKQSKAEADKTAQAETEARLASGAVDFRMSNSDLEALRAESREPYSGALPATATAAGSPRPGALSRFNPRGMRLFATRRP